MLQWEVIRLLPYFGSILQSRVLQKMLLQLSEEVLSYSKVMPAEKIHVLLYNTLCNISLGWRQISFKKITYIKYSHCCPLSRLEKSEQIFATAEKHLGTNSCYDYVFGMMCLFFPLKTLKHKPVFMIVCWMPLWLHGLLYMHLRLLQSAHITSLILVSTRLD